MKLKSLIIYFSFIILFISCKKEAATPPPEPVPLPQLGQYTVGGVTVNTVNSFEVDLGKVILTDKNNSYNRFEIYNMPVASSGTFNFVDYQSSNNTSPNGWLYDDRPGYTWYGTRSGTITKKGAREFTFQCTLYYPLVSGTTYQMSGSGKY